MILEIMTYLAFLILPIILSILIYKKTPTKIVRIVGFALVILITISSFFFMLGPIATFVLITLPLILIIILASPRISEKWGYFQRLSLAGLTFFLISLLEIIVGTLFGDPEGLPWGIAIFGPLLAILFGILVILGIIIDLVLRFRK